MTAIKERRKLEIIQAAIVVFRTHGFHKAKMEEIAKTAGIGKGTIYEYFDSKKDLFEEMMRYIVETYFNMAKFKMYENDTVKDKLVAFGKHHGSFINHYMDLAENNFPEHGFLSDKTKGVMIHKRGELFQLIGEVLEQGVQKGELRNDIDKEITINNIIGSINQNYTMQVCFQKIDPKDINPTPIIDIILTGLNRR